MFNDTPARKTDRLLGVRYGTRVIHLNNNNDNNIFLKKIKSHLILFIYLLTNVIHFVNDYI